MIRHTRDCFVGVYAAFVINAYQSRREQSDRRGQKLTWLDDYCGESAAKLENERTLIDEALTDSNRRLNNGEMPEPVYINSSFESTFSLISFKQVPESHWTWVRCANSGW
jgi:hypothetical protein